MNQKGNKIQTRAGFESFICNCVKILPVWIRQKKEHDQNEELVFNTYLMSNIYIFSYEIYKTIANQFVMFYVKVFFSLLIKEEGNNIQMRAGFETFICDYVIFDFI